MRRWVVEWMEGSDFVFERPRIGHEVIIPQVDTLKQTRVDYIIKRPGKKGGPPVVSMSRNFQFEAASPVFVTGQRWTKIQSGERAGVGDIYIGRRKKLKKDQELTKFYLVGGGQMPPRRKPIESATFDAEDLAGPRVDVSAGFTG